MKEAFIVVLFAGSAVVGLGFRVDEGSMFL